MKRLRRRHQMPAPLRPPFGRKRRRLVGDHSLLVLAAVLLIELRLAGRERVAHRPMRMRDHSAGVRLPARRRRRHIYAKTPPESCRCCCSADVLARHRLPSMGAASAQLHVLQRVLVAVAAVHAGRIVEVVVVVRLLTHHDGRRRRPALVVAAAQRAARSRRTAAVAAPRGAGDFALTRWRRSGGATARHWRGGQRGQMGGGAGKDATADAAAAVRRSLLVVERLAGEIEAGVVAAGVQRGDGSVKVLQVVGATAASSGSRDL